MAAIRAYEMPLFARLLDGLAGIDGLRLWGIADQGRFEERTPTAAVTLDGVSPEAASVALGERGDRDLVGQLLRGRADRAAGARARGRAAHRAHPLQHGRRGRPPGGRAGRDRHRRRRRLSAATVSGRRPAPDVAIVGGGIVGTALAAELAGRGVSVELYERHEVAAGASGRNSGAVWYPADPVLGVAVPRDPRALPPARRGGPVRAPGRGAGARLPPRRRARRDPHPRLGPGEAPGAGRGDRRGQPRLPRRVRRAGRPAPARARPRRGPGRASASTSASPSRPAAACRAFAALAVRRGARIRDGDERDGSSVRRAPPSPWTPATASCARGAVVVTAGPWTPAIIDPSGAWRPILPYWGVIVELGLEAPPTHVLEEAGVDAAIEPDGGLADAEDGAIGFSLVTADGRSSLGSTFLPFEPDPRDYERRLRQGGARYLPAIADAPNPGPPGLRTAARARRPPARRAGAGRGRRGRAVHGRRPRTVGDLDRSGIGGTRRGARAGRAGPARAWRPGRDGRRPVRRAAGLRRAAISASCSGRTGRTS